jgi:hypothetical protein
MNNLDLDAVKARHGIWTLQNAYARWIAFGARVSVRYDYPTESDAICALLKARYDIYTWHEPLMGLWCAEGQEENEEKPTELAAVVALADRLQGVAAK